jgi:hypothetical protein
MMADAAVTMAGGGHRLRDFEVLHHQQALLDAVASSSTLCRALDEVDEAALGPYRRGRAAVREHVWELIIAWHGRIPPARSPAVTCASRSCCASTRTGWRRISRTATPGCPTTTTNPTKINTRPPRSPHQDRETPR